MHLAAMLGHAFSVVTVLQRLRTQLENEARLYGVFDKLASVRAVDMPVLELETDLGRTRELLVEQAVLAVEQDGAHAIIFGCTGMLGCAEAVRTGLSARGYDVPVIDPVPAAVVVAAALVEAGLSHSKLTYPAPPPKRVVGYDELPLRVPAARAAE
jgi:allantoin racemase